MANSDPSITIKINAEADLAAVNQATQAVDELKTSLKDQPAVAITEADTSGIDQALQAIDALKDNASVDVTLNSDTSDLAKAKTGIGEIKAESPIKIDTKVDTTTIAAARAQITQLQQDASAATGTAGSALSSPGASWSGNGGNGDIRDYTDTAWQAVQTTATLTTAIKGIGAAVKGPAAVTAAAKSGAGWLSTQLSSATKLLGIFGKLAGTAGLITGAWKVGWWGGEKFSEFYDIEGQARKKKIKEAYEALEKERELLDKKNTAIWQTIDADDRAADKREEQRVVDGINRKYQERLNLINSISEAKISSISTEAKILSTEREIEKSMIRRKLLAGEITQLQADNALSNIDKKEAADQREKERKIDEQAVADATARYNAATKRVKELEAAMAKSNASLNKGISGADYLEIVSKANKEGLLKTKLDEEKQSREQKEGELKSIKGNTAAEEIRKKELLNQIDYSYKQEGFIKQQQDEVEEAKKRKKDIEEESGIDTSGMKPEEIVRAVKTILDDNQEQDLKNRDQYRDAQRDQQQSQIDQESTGRKLQENNKIRSAEEKRDNVLNAEKNEQSKADAAKRNLDSLSTSAQKAGDSLTRFVTDLRSSENKGKQSLLAPGTKSAEAIELAEKIVQRGATQASISKLEGLTKQAIAGQKWDAGENLLKNNLEPFIAQQRALLQKIISNTGGGELIKQTRERFGDNVRDFRADPQNAANPDRSIDNTLRDAGQMMADNTLTAAEQGKIKTMITTLARQANNKAAQEASLILQNAVDGMQLGQRKKSAQAQKRKEATTSPEDTTLQLADNQEWLAEQQTQTRGKLSNVEMAIEETKRNILNKLPDINDVVNTTQRPEQFEQADGDSMTRIMQDGAVDGAEVNEVRALLDKYTEMQAGSNNKDSYDAIISSLNSMISLHQMAANEKATLLSQLSGIDAKVRSIQSQMATLKSQQRNMQ